MCETKGQMGEINILDLMLYTNDLINGRTCHIRWLALTDYTVVKTSGHSLLQT